MLAGLGLRCSREIVLEPVTRSVDGEDMADVEQPVEDGGGDDVVAKELAPAVESDVRGDQERAFGVAGGDELEEEIGAAVSIGR